MKAKRKTWRDRRCSHGRPPARRIILDVVSCSTPGCYRRGMALAGFVLKDQHEMLASSAADAQQLLLDLSGRYGDRTKAYRRIVGVVAKIGVALSMEVR